MNCHRPTVRDDRQQPRVLSAVQEQLCGALHAPPPPRRLSLPREALRGPPAWRRLLQVPLAVVQPREQGQGRIRPPLRPRPQDGAEVAEGERPHGRPGRRRRQEDPHEQSPRRRQLPAAAGALWWSRDQRRERSCHRGELCSRGLLPTAPAVGLVGRRRRGGLFQPAVTGAVRHSILAEPLLQSTAAAFAAGGL